MGSDLTAAIGQTIDPLRLMQRVTERTLELISGGRRRDGRTGDDRSASPTCARPGQQEPTSGPGCEFDTSLSGLAVQPGRLQRSDDSEADSTGWTARRAGGCRSFR